MALLDIRGLSVRFRTGDGTVQAVNGLDLTLRAGETLGIVGESGSGKSQLAFAIMGLLARNGTATGRVLFDGQDILNAPPRILNRIRAERIAMIFQDPMTSLNPYMRVSDQMAEVLVMHKGLTQHAALAESVRMLDAVGIPDARGRIGLYPHEFSGGMRQRVMIAMALLCRPQLLIADEPTTALDVTVQAQIMALLSDLQRDFGMAMMLITHDLGIVAGACERVGVMYGGRIRESGPTDAIFADPAHPYTQGLLSAIPRIDAQAGDMATIPGQPPDMTCPPPGCAFAPRCAFRRAVCDSLPPPLEAFAEGRGRACFASLEEVRVGRPDPSTPRDPARPTQPDRHLLNVSDLRVTFQIRGAGVLPWARARNLHAVNGVDFTLNAGETLGVVGESGCGKSTLARALVGLVPATGRAAWIDGRNLIGLSPRGMQPYRSDIQMVFQDPLASLNPRMTVGQIIAEPLTTHRPSLGRAAVKDRVKAMMDKVGLLPNQINRYPHEFSGGQCQRIGIARALIVEPRLVICDEPVSALDVSIQAQVINLLVRLQDDLRLSLIFIAHDLAVVRHVSDRVMVLYLGKVMEIAPVGDLYATPLHPYTQALLSAVPVPDPGHDPALTAVPLRGDLPSPSDPPSGCVFRTRCPRAQPRCAAEAPLLQGLRHRTACHFPGPLTDQEIARARNAGAERPAVSSLP
ncbi:dipeptide ABC transporter ATP-binding protein [Paracoccus sediminis]|uniref:Peptide/nickel transport system ATP-binding protein n=1 Tax=Paracoccus sediminis TaxID=1214787 RepID=A0A238WU08_9RHOB|nr:dipeptide ABC transporter ATP-binding protein [Paracoccus sediminis]SNR50046.1 peptide/nickel transport system ATP-binding protein [Paracoccus sediminis]